MKFKTLKISNFGAIGSAEFSLDNRGLVLVTGRNDDASKADSNGAGKSLLLEAICWCLWGKTIRGLTSNEVVNETVGKNCWVSLGIEEHGSEYMVLRTRKCTTGPANDLRLTQDAADLTGASMAVTQEHVNELVGMDFTTFRALMPGAGLRVAEMTDKEVKLLLESLLQNDVMAKAYAVARDDLKAVAKQVAVHGAELEAKMKELSKEQLRLVSLETSNAGFEAECATDRARLRAQLEAVTLQLTEMDALIEQRGAQESALALGFVHLDADRAALSAATEQERLCRAAVAAEKAALATALGMLQADQKRAVASFKKTQSLGPTCSACDQSIPETHKAEALAAARTLVETTEAAIAATQSSSAANMAALSTDLQAAKVELDQCTEAHNSTTSMLSVHKTLLEKTKLREAALSGAQLLQDSIVAQIQVLDTAKNPYTALIDAAKAAVEEASTAVDGLRALVTDLLQQERRLNYWVTAFSPQGIRSYLLEHVTPFLNSAVQRYADMLTDGDMTVGFNTQQTLASGESVEKFNITVGHKHGGSSYTASSTGERSRANLAIAFALGDLAALRTNKSIPFRFLDEPFESVDESGIDAIVTLLNDQAKRYSSVFVVTHQDHFKQLFPTKMTVIKAGGVSRVEDSHD